MIALPSRPGPASRRLAQRLVLSAGCLLLTACGLSGGDPGATPSTPTTGPATSGAPTDATSATTPTSPPGRRLTEANLPNAEDLAEPIGGGKVVNDARNARSLDDLTICQSRTLSTLGATQVLRRSFRDTFTGSEPPFPRSALDNQPNSYVVALQFPDASSAERARSLVQSWVSDCGSGTGAQQATLRTGEGFEWRKVVAPPAAAAEVAGVVYELTPSAEGNAYFESVGLVSLGDRMTITVHLFYTDESPYSINVSDDEAGFEHPQLALMRAAASRLGT